MSTEKYGRLYTDADIRRLAERWLGDRAMGPDIMAETLAEFDAAGKFTFPADEPLFLLRAKDLAATVVFKPYADECEVERASTEHLESVWRSYDAFMKFVADHRDRVKVPD